MPLGVHGRIQEVSIPVQLETLNSGMAVTVSFFYVMPGAWSHDWTLALSLHNFRLLPCCCKLSPA